jgi:tetraprenyl-beta-curcumene synthase
VTLELTPARAPAPNHRRRPSGQPRPPHLAGAGRPATPRAGAGFSLLADLPALARVAGRELAWGLRECAGQVAHWRARAISIPDAPLRADALCALRSKRAHLDGAALFATLPRARSRELLHALVAYQTILEYLDEVNERAAEIGVRNGLQLHLALRDALDPYGPCTDYYRHHPWRRDGGYLHALVTRCQAACEALPGYEAVREPLLVQARERRVLALNHEPDTQRRARRLRQWAASEHRRDDSPPWYELAGAATGSLCIPALLALAADAPVAQEQVEAMTRVYPRISLLATMLDSYVDQHRDAREGSHSYVAYYGAPDQIVSRLAALIGECVDASRTLPGGRRHAVLVCSMVAMYLSSDSARSPALRRDTRVLARAGGPLTMRLLPALRAWRLAHDLAGA